MPTLQARYVGSPRKRFRCDWCERMIAGSHLYLYGSAEVYEEPYAVRFHLHCIDSPNHTDPKIKAALQKAREAFQELQELNNGRVQ